MRAKVERDRGDEAADDEHKSPGHLGCNESQAQDDREGDAADQQRRPVGIAQAPDPRGEFLPRVDAIGGRPGELGQLADDDVDGRAGQEPGHDGLRQEPRDPAHSECRDEQKQGSGRESDRRHQLGCLLAAEAGEQDGSAGHGRQR